MLDLLSAVRQSRHFIHEKGCLHADPGTALATSRRKRELVVAKGPQRWEEYHHCTGEHGGASLAPSSGGRFPRGRSVVRILQEFHQSPAAAAAIPPATRVTATRATMHKLMNQGKHARAHGDDVVWPQQ